MSGTQTVRALAALFAMGWRRAVAERVGLIGRMLLYGLVLLIFQAVWRATPLGELAGISLDESQLIWYVALTEWIVFATAYPYRWVETDILKGRIGWLAARPLAYPSAITAEWAGETTLRLIVLGLFGFAVTYAATGTVPIAPGLAPWVFLGGLLGMTLGFAIQLAIGLVASWLGTAQPIWWVTQKLSFILGGLLLPLPIYPDPIRSLAEASPFSAMLYWPASLVLGGEAGALPVILKQLAWLALLGAAAVALSEVTIRRVQRLGE
jgi:ABC-2 type transport system permease protein